MKLVSIHGGHSRQFCMHAENTLEEVVRAYIEKGFSWVGITEHMPPPRDEFIYPDESAAGLGTADLVNRFADYIRTGRALQKKYADRIRLFVGMETETCTGARESIPELKARFRPDYLVGSLHHVNDIPFDLGPESYAHAARSEGGLDQLYCRYFDEQYEMLELHAPDVVGHFDIIRMFDPDYRRRFENGDIRQRVRRNLETIRDLGAILDFNVRPLLKGQSEPYVTASILKTALSLGIPAVPGDDSHGVDSVGVNVQNGIEILAGLGFNTDWVEPIGKNNTAAGAAS
ncbi:MAG: histidinol-phosphatase [Desulfobacteraceae bacterium]|nr:histidinol-phosphatase [Desulfobacteraceae bacterium]